MREGSVLLKIPWKLQIGFNRHFLSQISATLYPTEIPRCGAWRTQNYRGSLCFEPRSYQMFPLCAWGRSEHSFACATCWQDFCLSGSFNMRFFVCLFLTSLLETSCIDVFHDRWVAGGLMNCVCPVTTFAISVNSQVPNRLTSLSTN